MITPSFSPTATERVLPKLALDFTTAVLDSRITFTRTTDATHPATYTNSSGAIVLATNNQPRFDYSNGICKGLLIEESRTNSLINSILDGAVIGSPGTPPTSWTNLQTTGSISAIDAGQYTTGYKITISTSNTRRSFYQTMTIAANTSYSFSFTVYIDTVTQVYTLADLVSGPAGSTIVWSVDGTTVASSYTIPIGTHKIVGTITTSSTAGTVQCRWGLGLQSNWTGNATFQNFQFETGSFATSYIPTTTTALTRNADVATMTGTNFSSWFNASEGTFEIQVINKGGDINGNFLAVQTDDGTDTNRIASIQGTAASRQYCYVSGVAQNNLNLGAVTINQVSKVTYAYAANNFAAAKLGASPLTNLSGTLPASFTTLRFGSSATAVNSGYVQKVYYFPMRLINNEVQATSKQG